MKANAYTTICNLTFATCKLLLLAIASRWYEPWQAICFLLSCRWFVLLPIGCLWRHINGSPSLKADEWMLCHFTSMFVFSFTVCMCTLQMSFLCSLIIIHCLLLSRQNHFFLYRNGKFRDTYVSGVILTLSMLIFELSMLTLVNNHARIRKSNAFAEISSPGQIYRTFFTFILHLTWLVQSTTCMYHSYSSSQSK